MTCVTSLNSQQVPASQVVFLPFCKADTKAWDNLQSQGCLVASLTPRPGLSEHKAPSCISAAEDRTQSHMLLRNQRRGGEERQTFPVSVKGEGGFDSHVPVSSKAPSETFSKASFMGRGEQALCEAWSLEGESRGSRSRRGGPTPRACEAWSGIQRWHRGSLEMVGSSGDGGAYGVSSHPQALANGQKVRAPRKGETLGSLREELGPIQQLWHGSADLPLLPVKHSCAEGVSSHGTSSNP